MHMTEFLELAQLSHAVVAPKVGEHLRIRMRDVKLPEDAGVDLREVRCKAYVGALKYLDPQVNREGIQKAKLKELRIDMHNGSATFEIDVGVPDPEEPWGIRVKLYHRPPAGLFSKHTLAELTDVIPRPMSRVACSPGGHVGLEVLRLVPSSAREALKEVAGRVLCEAVHAGVKTCDIEELCIGAKELGEDTLHGKGAIDALERAAYGGKVECVETLLANGVPSTASAARAAEHLVTPETVALAHTLLSHYVRPDGGGSKVSLLTYAIDERLPLVAEKLLDADPGCIFDLPPTAESAQRVHTAGAWSVLAALLNRGDEMPYQPRSLLDFALRIGHARLARACLSRCEGFDSMQAALHTCLDHGRTEIVREALELQWRQRSNQWNDAAGPSLLALECGPADEPAECSVCFEPLHRAPGVFVADGGFRACQHFCCLECAEHVQDEANDRLRVWRMRRDSRIPQPPGPVCPMCRAPFVQAVRLTDPTVDPRSFFRLSCLQECDDTIETMHLREKAALGVLCALLPLNTARFGEILNQELWPAWCKVGSSADSLVETDFLRPGGMLAWLSSHLLERKVEKLRGSPPALRDDPEKWFRFFDYDGKGFLSKAEVLRGVAKAYDVSALARPETSMRHTRSEGVQRLRDIINALWDEVSWSNGVQLSQFLEPNGLAERLLTALPSPQAQAMYTTGSCKRDASVSIEEALARARQADLQVCEEDNARAKERVERQRQALSVVPLAGRRGRGGEPGRAGAELMLASLIEVAREGSRGSVAPQIHIQCPFCTAVNQVRAASGHRVLCGGCRSTFAVPAAIGGAAVRPPALSTRRE